ncbi:NAD-dependent epimerase/dehydratase family protein [Amycolatopsis echigonensis]|uniref:NAD(P)-dependent oxidoreductase n=1 Tax=Amycolatopsis echigonensis TaxID=2576905 RepID=A0A2N3WPH4_9PSEU|nr:MULTISPECIES: NAD(P)-dependent oxidoreductase [Amycolatopsis]MBB2502015.1 NAD(P)-dependent oxidoreductase [Amycolatopsis echigonensis]PKV95760.1 nucleoside-diphosphate-sugar epimerase [Amycolatopsis niigatensis]
MRVLVIGASGFLGGHVRRAACARGFDVVTAGRSPVRPADRDYLFDLSACVAGDLAELLVEVAPDAVVNCAGAVAGDAETLTRANVAATENLVHAVALADRGVRLVHLGSAAEYGRGSPGVPVREDASPRPIGPYGMTKLLGTQSVVHARERGLDCVVLRVFNPVGAGASLSGLPGRAAAALRKAVADGSDLRLGPLDAVRDFVDARDVADAVLAALAVPALPPVLNVGSGRGLSARALVKELLEASGAGCAVYEDAPGSVRSADVPWQEADLTLTTRTLPWSPRRDLADAVADLWSAS